MGFFWPRVNSQRNLMSNFYLGSNLKIWFAWRNSNEISNLVKIKLKVLVDFFNFCNQWYEFDFSFRSYLQHWFACLSPFLELQNLKDTTEEFQRNLSVAQDYKSKLQDMVITYIFYTAKEDTEKILPLQYKYSKSLSWAENLNKLFTVLGGEIQIFCS